MDSINLSGYDFASITPSDTDFVPHGRTTGLYIAATANITVDDPMGNPVTFTGLAGGIVHPIRTKRVRSTGTTATGIVGLWLQGYN